MVYQGDFAHFWLSQAHKAELKEVQSQLDQAYNDLSELQYNTDQEKAALEDKAQAAQQQLQVRLHWCSSCTQASDAGLSQYWICCRCCYR